MNLDFLWKKPNRDWQRKQVEYSKKKVDKKANESVEVIKEFKVVLEKCRGRLISMALGVDVRKNK